jgi:hypothetical protein
MAEDNHFAKAELAKELLKFCNEPFPNGATIKEWNGVDGGMAPDGTIVRTIS